MTGILVFPVLAPYREDLQKAIDLGANAYSIEDIEQMIAMGTAQMWPNGESVIVTEVTQYPRAKHLTCSWLVVIWKS